MRTLHLGGEAIQSAMRLSAPDRLELAYTRAMMAFLLFAPAPRDLLMVGLGGGSIARFIHERLPRTRITVVEINSQVVAAARTFFGLPADDRRLRCSSATVPSTCAAYRGACDVILLDAFDDGRSVKTARDRSFLRRLPRALRPSGVFAVNFIADEPRFGTYLARIERVFDGRVLCLPSEDRMNMIVLGLRGRADAVPIAPLKRAARELERRHGLRFARFARDLIGHNKGDVTAIALRRED